MGSYNGTCGVTNLPIMENNPVVVMLITQTPFIDTHARGSDFCYPTDKWNIIGLPFEATYDDYGRFAPKDENDPILKYNLEYIKKNLVEMELGENEYRDIEIKRNAFDLDLLQEGIHEGRLALSVKMNVGYPMLKASPVGRFMVHKSIYDIMANEYYADLDKLHRGRALEYNCSMRDYYSRYVNVSDRCINNLYDLIYAFDDDTVFDSTILPGILKVSSFARYMGHTRKSLAPQCGAGSQDQDYDPYIKLAKEAQQIIVNDLKRYEDDYEDEE